MSDIFKKQLTTNVGFQANISYAYNLSCPFISHPNMTIITIDIGYEVITMCSNMKRSTQINHPITGMASEIYWTLIINNTQITIIMAIVFSLSFLWATFSFACSLFHNLHSLLTWPIFYQWKHFIFPLCDLNLPLELSLFC